MRRECFVDIISEIAVSGSMSTNTLYAFQRRDDRDDVTEVRMLSIIGSRANVSNYLPQYSFNYRNRFSLPSYSFTNCYPKNSELCFACYACHGNISNIFLLFLRYWENCIFLPYHFRNYELGRKELNRQSLNIPLGLLGCFLNVLSGIWTH